MKLFYTILFILFTQVAAAQDYQLGVVLGAPTGISGKMGVGNNRSVDAVLAYSLVSDFGLEFHADYLVERARSFDIRTGTPLELYYGIGARLVDIRKGKHDGDVAIGPRAPLGVNYQITNPDLEFFGELALAFDVVPETNLDLEGGIGVRFRF